MLLQANAEFTSPYPGAFSRQFNLFNNQSAVGSSIWVPTELFANGTIEIQALNSLSDAVLQLFGTMTDDPITPPATGYTTGTQIGTNVTLSANGFLYITNPYRFVRLNLESIAAGAINAILLLTA